VTAGQDIAFAVAIMRCGPDSSSNPADKDGFLSRLTVDLRKVNSELRIAPEHHCVPATDWLQGTLCQPRRESASGQRSSPAHP
jgi:hypothetical protein